MVKRNAIATKLTKICTQIQKRAFDVAVKREIMKNSQVLHIFICEFFDSKCSSLNSFSASYFIPVLPVLLFPSMGSSADPGSDS